MIFIVKRKEMTRFLKLFLASSILTSCVSTYQVKKQHSSGSYISWHGKHKKKYTKHSLAN